MGIKYTKSVDYTKLTELASNYNIADIAQGKVKGKGTGALRNLENRLRVISILAPKSQFLDLDKTYDIMEEKADSYYWKKIMKQPERQLERCVDMATMTMQNELMPYSCSNNLNQPKMKIEETSPQNENMKGYQNEDRKEVIASKNCGKNRLATVALIGALGLSFLTGYITKGNQDKKIIQEKEKPHMLIVTDLPSREIDKRYEQYSKQEKEGRIPILDLRRIQSDRLEKKISESRAESKKTEDKEIWGNRGYIYRNDSIPEYKKHSPEERARLKARWANIDEKIKRDTKKLGVGLYDFVKLKHPIGGPLRAVSGFGGIVNGVVRGLVRPIAYFLTRTDKIDDAIDDFMDASYFGDSYNVLHGKALGFKIKETGQFIKEHPIKSTISIAEDILPFIHCKGGGEEAAGGAGTAHGRGGGAAELPGRGGGAGAP